MKAVIGMDGSKYSEWALGWLGAMPFRITPRVTAIHAMDLNSARAPLFTHPSINGYEPDVGEAIHLLETRAKQVEADTKQKMKEMELNGSVRVEQGPITTALLKHAGSTGLIVVGSRGLDAVDRFILGSASTTITLHAASPVLIVKEPPHPLRRILFATYGNNLGVFEILSVNPFKYQQIADYSVASQLKGVSAAKDLGVLFPLFTAASGSSSLAYLTSDGPAGQLPIAPSAAWNVSFHEQTDDRLYVINKSSALNTSILREFDTAANPPSETGRQVTLPQCDAVALSLSFDDSAWIANEGRSGIYVSYELEATILPMGESRGAVDVAASKTVDVLRAYFTTGPKQLFACAVS